jgi:hypothetical protein
MDTLKELLGEVALELGAQAGPRELARALLEEALARPDATAVLYPAVLSWVADAGRDWVRDAEQRAFSQEPGGLEEARNPNAKRPPGPYVNPAQTAMQNLLVQNCYVEGHGLVPWGMMTAAYHQVRAAYLTRVRDSYVAGVSATIRRHAAAAALLDGSGCTDLNEYAAVYGALPADLAESEGGMS